MKPIQFNQIFEVKAPLAKAWEIFSNTEKLNRSMGLPPVTYEKGGESSSTPLRKAQSKMMGMTLRWEEAPFEWVQEQYYSEERRFMNGPMKKVKMRLEFQPKGEGTELILNVGIEPRNFLYWLLIKGVLGRKIIQDFKKLVNHFNKHEDNQVKTPLPKANKFKVSESILSKRLKPVLTEYPQYEKFSKLLSDHIQNGFDNEVLAMRPFELADRWSVERKDLLEFFLHAARAGVIDLKWAILCPTCKVSVGGAKTLGKLKQTVHCDGCKIEYDSEFDRSVEARFEVNPAIRLAKAETFCTGGPGNFTQSHGQFLLEPHEERSVQIHLPSNRWNVVGFGVGEGSFQTVKEGDQTLLTLGIEQKKISPSKDKIKEGDITLQIKNNLDRQTLIRLEEDNWTSKAVTAAYITSLAKFRDLFSSEVLAPGEEISVRNLTVMFTDIKGSTSFYQETGDAKAYHLVRSHFDFLNEILDKHKGALVKTIGDAIFAVFFSPLEGIQAAVEIQQKIKEFNAKNGSQFVLKLGIHNGPLIAVNANGRIDYFGSTTNIGSRLEKESKGGDIILTQSIAEDPDSKQFLKEKNFKQENLATRLRGIDTEFQLIRLLP